MLFALAPASSSDEGVLLCTTFANASPLRAALHRARDRAWAA
jgi:hypothetical protein